MYANSDRMWMLKALVLVSEFGARENEEGDKRTMKENRAGCGGIFQQCLELTLLEHMEAHACAHIQSIGSPQKWDLSWGEGNRVNNDMVEALC